MNACKDANGQWDSGFFQLYTKLKFFNERFVAWLCRNWAFKLVLD